MLWTFALSVFGYIGPGGGIGLLGPLVGVLMAVVGALFIHIGLSLFAGSKILNQFFGVDDYLSDLFGVDLMWSIVLISLATALYTVAGGLKAVVVTESIQTILLLIGAFCVTILGLDRQLWVTLLDPTERNGRLHAWRGTPSVKNSTLRGISWPKDVDPTSGTHRRHG